MTRTAPEIERLVEQLERSLEGEAWHGPSVLELLSGVSADEAAAHPISGAHSIWEIVLHLTTDYSLLLRRVSGDGRALAPEEDWPPCPAVTEENWSKAKRDLAKLNRELRQAVRAFPEARLDEPLVSEVPYTAYTQFIGVTQHNLYHAGQIALLERALSKSTTATIIPSIRYNDAAAAIEWLCDAFGFEKHLVVPGEGDEIAHAQLVFGNGMLMVGSARDDEFGQLQAPIPSPGMKVSQSPYVIVSDVEAHHERAAARGAEIVYGPEDQPYGGSLYSCRDPEGNLWSFGSYDPWTDD